MDVDNHDDDDVGVVCDREEGDGDGNGDGDYDDDADDSVCHKRFVAAVLVPLAVLRTLTERANRKCWSPLNTTEQMMMKMTFSLMCFYPRLSNKDTSKKRRRLSGIRKFCDNTIIGNNFSSWSRRCQKHCRSISANSFSSTAANFEKS